MLRRLISSRAGKLGVSGAIVLALSAPALAEHFDFDSLEEGQPVTAEQVHVDCGGLGEAECEGAVQEAVEELENYDHPENHGKYVSYLTHCLKGMKGKGEFVSQMAQESADESGDHQAELAVELCAEWKILQLSAEGDEVGTLSGKSKGKKNADEFSGEVEGEDDTEVSTANGGNGKGNGKGKGRRGPK